MRNTCLNMVYELAQQDPRVVYIGSDPGPGTLSKMQAAYPDRFFIEGISEQNVIGMAAGLAMAGYIPYVNTIATFLTRRCLEQVAVDVCLHQLPVRLIANGGGMVYAPLGPTHTAIEDIALMRALPGMAVVVPTDAEDMRSFMPSTLQWPGPMYIRLAKGKDPVVANPLGRFDIGVGRAYGEPGEVLLVATGIMVHAALEAANGLRASGVDCAVLSLPTVVPMDVALLTQMTEKARLVVTVEEHLRDGGLGTAVLETLADLPRPMPVIRRLGLPVAFRHQYGSQANHLQAEGLTAAGIVQTVQMALN
ncbi:MULTISPECIES: transketolase family protein [unclassified Paludibacterium]|uniref:transketolase family protein n=1 Tax=unclassified Paludibacterium TaxID=2618429 RepID=UPI001C042265|nr:transketolase C-terminal domain-containing protein [Paludibacterium sp. B53371]BEV72218.1 transketolase C-terminal domain-containing protein [Paludibacterium sp. THUN1379]